MVSSWLDLGGRGGKVTHSWLDFGGRGGRAASSWVDFGGRGGGTGFIWWAPPFSWSLGGGEKTSSDGEYFGGTGGGGSSMTPGLRGSDLMSMTMGRVPIEEATNWGNV